MTSEQQSIWINVTGRGAGGGARGNWPVAVDVESADKDWQIAEASARKLARRVEGRGRRVNHTTLEDMSAAAHAALIAWRAGFWMPGEDRGAGGVAWRAAVAELDRDQFGHGQGVSMFVPWDESTDVIVAAVPFDVASARREQVGHWIAARRRVRRPSTLAKLRATSVARATAGLNARSAARRSAAMARAFAAIAAVIDGAEGESAAVAQGFKASGNSSKAIDSLALYLERVGVYDRGWQWGVTQGKVRRLVECTRAVYKLGAQWPASHGEQLRDAARARVRGRGARKSASARPSAQVGPRVWVAGPPWVRPGSRAWRGFEAEPSAVRAPAGMRDSVGGRGARVSFRTPPTVSRFGPDHRTIDSGADYVQWWQGVLGLLLPVRYDRAGGVLGDVARKLSALRGSAVVARADRRARVFVGRLRQRSAV